MSNMSQGVFWNTVLTNPQIVKKKNLWSLHPSEGKHANIYKLGKPYSMLISFKEKYRRQNAPVATVLDTPHLE